MTDFAVRTGDLRSTADDLDEAVEVAREVHSHDGALRALGAGAGPEVACSAADHFLSRWSYGMGLISGDADSLSKMLHVAADGYERLEQSLADGLK